MNTQMTVIPKQWIDDGLVQVVSVMNTTHMTKEDDRLLTKAVNRTGIRDPKLGFVVRDMEPGYLLNLWAPGNELVDALEQAKAYGQSDELRNIIHATATEGYTHLRLDPDAPESDRWLTFNW